MSNPQTLRERLQRHDPTLTIPASVSVAELPPGVTIISMNPEGIGAQAGLLVGDKLLRINGKGVRDTLDFYFHGADEELELELERDGKPLAIAIAKEWPEQSLEIEIEQFTTQNCGCNCVFCFVHQLPDNMRKTLYVKDEDYRLSFLQGSYVTGVTLKEADLARIAEQRLMPLYISVHAIDEELRRWLLGIKKAYPIRQLLDFIRDNRLEIHTQIVLCPGKNDGEKLAETLDALLSYHPFVASIAIVPLGMTKWRDGLPELQPVTPEYARGFIRSLKPRMKDIQERFGEPVALLADEWYLIAGLKPPAYSRFPDMPQLENGVGMVYHFYKDFAKARRALPPKLDRKWRVAAITSTLSPPVLKKVHDLCETCEGLEVDILPTVNTLFGETIHVTGLLGGGDIGKAIRHNPFYDQYLLPGNCLRKEDAKFIDDMPLDDLRAQTKKLVTPVLGGSLDFVETILEAATGRPKQRLGDHPFLRPHWSNS
ncbi:MAG: DUF512 domain-containing protein [Candidatus Sumerlaeia bacterium]|nr:DUF512 domain-containing protein [Candidatus Sumerlaeia bacterium]